MRRPHLTRAWLRQRLVEEMFLRPAPLLLPVFVGFPLIFAPWFFPNTGMLALAGLVLTVGFTGLYATIAAITWGNAEKVMERILQRAMKQADSEARARLAATRRKLLSDGDPLTEQMFDRLMTLQDTLRRENQARGEDFDTADLLTQVERLVVASVENLDTSADLAAKARQTPIPSLRTEIIRQRKQMLDETLRSIRSVEQLIVGVVKNRSDNQQSETARLRAELEAQLEISARVRNQMDSWTPEGPQQEL